MRSLVRNRASACLVGVLWMAAACGGEGPAGPPGGGGPPEARPVLAADFRPSGHAAAGHVFVHLFEWPWADVATECEQVLGPAGVHAVQVSPPQEHAVISGHPWWQRYQPVSYTLESRSGDADAFREMVERCDAAGVGIYVDAVLNHMTAGGGTGSAGTDYTKYAYPGLWDAADFHPACQVNNYQNAANVQDCELLGLADLVTGAAEVQETLADYLVALAELGVAGFRLDAAKHIQPVELEAIVDRANRAVAAGGRPLPFWFAEVIDWGSEAVAARDYYGLGYASGGAADITEFRFRGVRDAFTGANGQTLADLATFSPAGWGLIPSTKAVVFMENHDTQREGDGLTWRDEAEYRLAQLWLLAQPYGHPKLMSSYDFSARDQGPPSGVEGATTPVTCPAPGEDPIPGGWVCEHRDPALLAMVGFRRVTAGEPVADWWDNGGDAVAFSRGDRGWVAMNLEGDTVAVDAPTGLPPGDYCDVLTGGTGGGGCAGASVTVDADGRIQVELPPGSALALHVEATS